MEGCRLSFEKRYSNFINSIVPRIQPTRIIDYIFAIVPQILMLTLFFASYLLTEGNHKAGNWQLVIFMTTMISLHILAMLFFKLGIKWFIVRVFPYIVHQVNAFAFIYYISLYFGSSSLRTFGIFIFIDITYHILNFYYQLSLVKELPKTEIGKKLLLNKLYLPMSTIGVVTCMVLIVGRLFSLNIKLMYYSAFALAIVFQQMLIHVYIQAFDDLLAKIQKKEDKERYGSMAKLLNMEDNNETD